MQQYTNPSKGINKSEGLILLMWRNNVLEDMVAMVDGKRCEVFTNGSEWRR
jgi:hypothetical protein